MNRRGPTFEPWLGRVKVARALGTGIGFVLVTGTSRMSSLGWDEALFRGFGASVVCFFLAWGAALWVCGELYAAEINRMRRRMQEQESERQRKIEELAQERMNFQGGGGDFGPGTLGANADPLRVSPAAPPPRREAA